MPRYKKGSKYYPEYLGVKLPKGMLELITELTEGRKSKSEYVRDLIKRELREKLEIEI